LEAGGARTFVLIFLKGYEAPTKLEESLSLNELAQHRLLKLLAQDIGDVIVIAELVDAAILASPEPAEISGSLWLDPEVEPLVMIIRTRWHWRAFEVEECFAHGQTRGRA